MSQDLPQPTSKICPCGSAFTCQASTGNCWCAKLPPLLAVPKLPTDGKTGDCFCPECLEQKLAETQTRK